MERNRPNIVLIMNDDMGYSDLGCYGGEIDTPNLNRLAENGLRFTQFYNTARCSPSRASLLTGLHPHQTGIGILTEDDGPDGYPGNLNRNCVTIAEALGGSGYRTYMSGKWHVAHDFTGEKHTWPKQRGFDRFYGTIAGAGSFYDPNTLTRDNENIEHEAEENRDFYYTDAISDNAVRFIRDHQEQYAAKPYFLYVAYTAPHWPLHARETDIAKYKGRFDEGWDRLREQRLERLVRMELLDGSWRLTGRDPSQPEWEAAKHKEWLLRCIEVYAAQIDAMDQGIGRILAQLEAGGDLENTVVIFLADNGGCAEVMRPENGPNLVNKLLIARSHTRDGERVHFGNDPWRMPGPENTYQSYGIAWANLSNTPFRLYKHWVHEGGIATPFMVHWPAGISERGGLRHTPCQLPDIMATVLELTGTDYPTWYQGHAILPLEGRSMASLLAGDIEQDRELYWEHEGNAAVRSGTWKLVKRYPQPWELYDMVADRTEMNDVSAEYPEVVKQLSGKYEKWALRCGVVPRENILNIYNS
ncbi:arylsulfatase [Paenibacillus piri]|uniref:Arylsulfatase n=1 Tax=Paenibacillus piri TaxID=2547395 RepID=A0A4R5KRP7_9BACL|nr:arylsulfatase [Paenibacillus piri]TDF97480.1 arylsulfatase [Paenibacillus piri]